MGDEIKVVMPVMSIGKLNKNLRIYDEGVTNIDEWYEKQAQIFSNRQPLNRTNEYVSKMVKPNVDIKG